MSLRPLGSGAAGCSVLRRCRKCTPLPPPRKRTTRPSCRRTFLPCKDPIRAAYCPCHPPCEILAACSHLGASRGDSCTAHSTLRGTWGPCLWAKRHRRVRLRCLGVASSSGSEIDGCRQCVRDGVGEPFVRHSLPVDVPLGKARHAVALLEVEGRDARCRAALARTRWGGP